MRLFDSRTDIPDFFSWTFWSKYRLFGYWANIVTVFINGFWSQIFKLSEFTSDMGVKLLIIEFRFSACIETGRTSGGWSPTDC